MSGVPSAEAQTLLNMVSQAAPAATAPGNAQEPRDFVAELRAQMSSLRAFEGAPPTLYAITDHQFTGTGGALPIRIYRPAPGLLPTLLYFHGGGFVGGSLDDFDIPLRKLSQKTGWVIVAVEYRLAPEHPYPAAPEDCYAALVQLAANASSLEIDGERIVTAGDSAGGLLAASVALMTRDRRGPPLAGMICLYPNTDMRDDRSYPSMEEHDGKLLNLKELTMLFNLYLPDRRQQQEPYASPVLAPDLTGLAPALIITCECDPLCDEGEAFAGRLRGAGIPVDTLRLDGALHGVISLTEAQPSAASMMMARISSWLKLV